MLNRMKVTALSLALGALLAGFSSSAMADDAADGKQLFLKRTCIACHGKDGAKAILMYPNLAGQSKEYMLAQIKDIASGARVSGPDARGYPRTQAMKDVMTVVTPDEIKTIVEWLATQPPAPVAAGDAAKAAAGAQVYNKSGCPSCHGKDGMKPLAGYPIVAGQKKEYVALQIKEIRDGVRTNGKAKMMQPMAKPLKDEQIDALAEFLSQVNRSAPK